MAVLPSGRKPEPLGGKNALQAQFLSGWNDAGNGHANLEDAPEEYRRGHRARVGAPESYMYESVIDYIGQFKLTWMESDHVTKRLAGKCPNREVVQSADIAYILGNEVSLRDFILSVPVGT